MKAISVQQPWASLIACGLKDVENRKWALKTLPVRVLLHAGARRQPLTDRNMPYPWYWHIENYQKMGWLPALEHTPVSAVVGAATIVACEKDNKSLWAMRGPGAEFQWVMKDVQLFKEPITGVKGMLGLFDLPGISEDNLPEAVPVTLPRREGDTLYIPLNDRLFSEISDGERNSLAWNIVDENLTVFTDHFLKPLPTRRLVVTNRGESIELELGRYTASRVMYENGEYLDEEDDLGRVYHWWEARMEFE